MMRAYLLTVWMIWSALPALSAHGAQPDPWAGFLARTDHHQPTVSYPYAACFGRSARRYQLPLALVVAVASGESAFDPLAHSVADAYGIMQIRWPQTAAHLGVRSHRELLNPCTNIDAGTRYLAELVRRYDGDVGRSLAAYNMGPGRVSDSSAIPIPGAGQRYSKYIYSHLMKLGVGEWTGVVGAADSHRREPKPDPDTATRPRTGQEGVVQVKPQFPFEHAIATFSSPVRARALAQALAARHPHLETTVRCEVTGRYVVGVHLEDPPAYRRAMALLHQEGLGTP